jgi:hypothetical protein
MKINYLHLGILTTSILISGCHSKSPNFKSLIGKEYRTLTEFDMMKGYEEPVGIMLESLNDNEYGLSSYKKGPIDLIAFERVIRQANGETKYSLIDILEINDRGKNQYIICGLCRLNEKTDKDIVAVYQDKNSDVQFYTKIIKAWKANRKTGKFEQIDTKGIDCINEEYHKTH